jgi:hypothetical protein
MSDQLTKKFKHENKEYELIPNSTSSIPYIMRDEKGVKLYLFDMSEHSSEYSVCTFGGNPKFRLSKQRVKDIIDGKEDVKEEPTTGGSIVYSSIPWITIGGSSGTGSANNPLIIPTIRFDLYSAE